MQWIRTWWVAAALMVVAASSAALISAAPAAPAALAQPARPAVNTAPRTGTLVVAGDVGASLTLSPADLKALPRKTVKREEDGRAVSYEGVLVSDLLKKAGAPAGADLRGNAVASYVIASANDGYQVVFSVAELDPVFTGSEIIVADTADGKPLFDYQGPFCIIAPRDTRAARSVRMLERLELVRLRK